ncbi:hypothetical protein AA0313_0676 [Acetobacter indonesiensis NRIC 0313]|uniref:Type I-E CRISPR-associated protein Cse1/CasA n=1 Tax=Acetobacter indonesiensis TaxID=104101 RepID=A0A6N3T8E5_9PROT|nr:type I-E CRISPR-associated protein Cse1/CasA [Acetobacter indonesiensis]GAN64033.1 hypothetical protein Abin_053_002 [Acetobacter indonesiensis]GBQ54845.1 hypothetical protein AA0313_0676 [Acetobacter indonesiensis NRIC 0313]GEN03829.1 type I-E CRISPR-associated protein Cse1/CasA [Acetobacter indonesiensis]
MTDDKPFNLLLDPWLPVSRRSGEASVIRPAQIVEDIKDNPIVGFMWPRADFRVASFEFLIGLLATACPPETHRAWVQNWLKPPSVEQLDEAFAKIADAFWLDGLQARFLQDYDTLQSDSEYAERLLIDAPGESTVKRNADLFVHRGQVERMARSTAAIALFTLQSWAPSGGAGNMTGLRGGGPLTTLVLPEERGSLWRIVWANVPNGSAIKNADKTKVFPWLAPTVASGKDGTDVRISENAHPLQCWWGMPRRIRLVFEKNNDQVCDLTGQSDTVLVTGWQQRPYGPKYAGWIGMPYGAGTVHPLTPRYQQKTGAEWLAIHPQPGGIGYRHWAGIVVESADGNKLPASCVVTWRNERARDVRLSQAPRLLAAGYDMDNMKARGFIESEMPLFDAQDIERQKNIDILARDCVGAATQIADLLRSSVREALFGKATVSVDVTLLANLRERFWEQTESDFFAILHEAVTTSDDVALKTKWFRILAHAALREFDLTVTLEPETTMQDAKRFSAARKRLSIAVAGKGTEGKKIMNGLGLPVLTDKKTEKIV